MTNQLLILTIIRKGQGGGDDAIEASMHRYSLTSLSFPILQTCLRVNLELGLFYRVWVETLYNK